MNQLQIEMRGLPPSLTILMWTRGISRRHHQRITKLRRQDRLLLQTCPLRRRMTKQCLIMMCIPKNHDINGNEYFQSSGFSNCDTYPVSRLREVSVVYQSRAQDKGVGWVAGVRCVWGEGGRVELFLFLNKIYFVTPNCNRLSETVRIRGHNIYFYGKNIENYP